MGLLLPSYPYGFKMLWEGPSQNNPEKRLKVESVPETFALPQSSLKSNIGALTITCTILGVPYYADSIMGPKTLF